VVAYELLFRDRADASAAASRDGYATARVLTAAWGSFGLTSLVGNMSAFVNLSREFITGELPLPVSPTQVGVEIPHDVTVDAELVAGVAALAERGFTVVLDNYTPGTPRTALLPLATYVKVDHLDADPARIDRALAEVADVSHLQLIAYRLETPAAVAGAVERGFVLFQGNGLGHPYVMTTDVPAPHWPSVAAVLDELERPEPDRVRLTELVDRTPSLARSIRRILNVPAGAPSVDLAAGSLDELRDWARLLRSMAGAQPDGLAARQRVLLPG
jgi:EAL and modified HD-GYP domain-containing signal transduction protein